MKIHIANQSKQTLGGGFTFLRTFEKYAKRDGIEFCDFQKGVDIFFISGATMVTRDQVQAAKDLGMKIVLRVDNIPRNSRNRNTGTSRLKDFAAMADLVVYQSNWAKNYIGPFLADVDKSHGPVILNGADEEVFNTNGAHQPQDGSPQCMFIQYNRDETKRWHETWYDFQMLSRKDKNAHLWIVGNFSPENIEYKFDFYMGEKYRYVGVLDNPNDIAEYLRATHTLFIPYFNDACSNSLIEARLCGVKNILCNETGGNPEIMSADLEDLKASNMVKRYLNEISKIL